MPYCTIEVSPWTTATSFKSTPSSSAASCAKEVFGRGEVPPADFDGVEAEFVGDQIYRALDDVSGFGSARAAVGVGRHLVGEDACDVDLYRGDFVRAGEHQARQGRDGRREQLVVRAEVCDDVVAQARQSAVQLTADLYLADLAAPVNRRLHVLAPRLDPLGGPAQSHRNPSEQGLLGVDVQLRAEAAADFRRDDTELVFGDADHQRDLRTHEVRYLRRRPEGQLLLSRKVSCQHPARLHRDGREALIGDALPDYFVRGSERRLDVALAGGQFIRDVVAELFVYHRAALRRLLRVNDRGQLLVVNHDEVCRVARGVSVRGDDGRDGVADEVDLVRGEDSVVGHLQVGQVARARHGADLLRHVLARVDGDDARRLQGLARVHTIYPRVRVDRAHEGDVQRVRQAYVVNVVRQPLNQPRVFRALHSPSDVSSHKTSGNKR